MYVYVDVIEMGYYSMSLVLMCTDKFYVMRFLLGVKLCSLWEQRNSFLHKTNHSFHPKERNDIILKIEYEKNKGLDNLDSTYSSLFSDSIETLLEKSHVDKLNTIRELENPSYFLNNKTFLDPLT